ncbi:MAG: hypothetical protein EAX86_11690 [Candidatus Heimdallarchaeota archaeon]|nr:hypothetical protein [Candidatus Heimdallarchaeota archaeon]
MDTYEQDVIKQLVTIIESKIASFHYDRSRTHQVKKKQRNNNTIISWNIHPSFETPLEYLIPELLNVIEAKLEEIQGEVIHFTITSGDISNTGYKEFKIISGHSWEIYLYSPETFIYLRLLLETKKGHPEEKWISIDIDIVSESAWFTE